MCLSAKVLRKLTPPIRIAKVFKAMPPERQESNAHVTVLVLKDNLVSRSFELPVAWFTRLGWMLGGAIGITTISLGIATYWGVRYHWTESERVRELELQNQTIKNRLAQLDPTALQDATSLTPTQPSSGAPAPSQAAAPVVAANVPAPEPAPVPTVALAQPTQPTIPASAAQVPTGLNFRLSSPQLSWKGRTLQVRSAIQYIADDGGNQQGRIVILARGPDTLMAYPKGVLDTNQAKSLINPLRGEFFSVSRMRPIQADFGPLDADDTFTEVTVMILSQAGKLLYETKVGVPARPAGEISGGAK
jgi:hypothetical protein